MTGVQTCALPIYFSVRPRPCARVREPARNKTWRGFGRGGNGALLVGRACPRGRLNGRGCGEVGKGAKGSACHRCFYVGPDKCLPGQCSVAARVRALSTGERAEVAAFCPGAGLEGLVAARNSGLTCLKDRSGPGQGLWENTRPGTPGPFSPKSL